jgi:hypothetical protein
MSVSVPPTGRIHRVPDRMDLEQDGNKMGWYGFMKGYNNKGDVTFGEDMRMHEEDRRDI